MSNGKDWGYVSSDNKGTLTYTRYEDNGSVNRYSDNGDGGHSHSHWDDKNDYNAGKDPDQSRSESNSSENPTSPRGSDPGCFLTTACMNGMGYLMITAMNYMF